MKKMNFIHLNYLKFKSSKFEHQFKLINESPYMLMVPLNANHY